MPPKRGGTITPMTFLGIGLIGWAGLFIALSTFVISLLTFALARERTQVLWAAFCLAVCIWSGSFFALGQIADSDTALLWWRISHLGVIFIPVLFFHFSLSYVGIRESWLHLGLYAAGIALSVVDLRSNLLIDGVRWVFDEMFYDTPGPLYLPFVVMFALLVGAGLMLIYRDVDRRRGREHLRSQYLLLASTVGFIGGTVSFAPVFGIDIYPLTILSVAIAPPVVGYAILKYHLFDFRVVLGHFLRLAVCAGAIGQLVLSENSRQVFLHAILTTIGLISAIYFIRQFDRKSKHIAE